MSLILLAFSGKVFNVWLNDLWFYIPVEYALPWDVYDINQTNFTVWLISLQLFVEFTLLHVVIFTLATSTTFAPRKHDIT